jgi:hypothetical protein
MNARLANDERGAALLVALLIGTLLAGLGAVLITVSNTETLITAGHRYAQETAYAAESAFERALRDLDVVPDWGLVLAPSPANLQATFTDGVPYPRAPDGRALDLNALTLRRQAESDREAGPGIFGADSPQWRLFGHASLASLLPAGMPAQPAYLVVWVADDGLDGDGDSARDANGRLLLFVEAHGTAGTRRAVEAVVGRADGGVVQILTRRVAW